MIEVVDLGKKYGEVWALRPTRLRVEDGEFFSLLGPSGCGKTTLLRMLAGLETPTRGEIRHRGVRIDPVASHHRPFNLVFQRYALFPHLDVRGNVAFGLESQRIEAREVARRVEEALQLVQLQGFEARAIHTLSGGQQQRVALARALVNRPAVLLLDEPLSALDLRLRRQMQLELRALQKRLGLIFLFVTHDQEEAMALSDRIAVMDHGEIIQTGKPEDVYRRPRSLRVAEFLGELNRVDGQVVGVDSHSGWLRVRTASGWELRACARQGREPGSYAPGERVAVVVRPECLRPVSGSADAGNVLEAAVEERTFLGATSQLRLRFAGAGAPWLVDLRQGEASDRWEFEPGHAVALELEEPRG